MRKQVALLSIGLIPAEILPCCESTKRCQIKRFKNRQTTMQTIEHFKFKGWVWNPTAQQLWKVLLQILDARESDAMRCPWSMESSIIRFIRFRHRAHFGRWDGELGVLSGNFVHSSCNRTREFGHEEIRHFIQMVFNS